jgi:hypothetical protein
MHKIRNFHEGQSTVGEWQGSDRGSWQGNDMACVIRPLAFHPQVTRGFLTVLFLANIVTPVT